MSLPRNRSGAWRALALCLLSTAAAAPAPENALDELVADYLARRPSHSLHAGMSLTEARQMQDRFVARLKPSLGPTVGYKAGLINKAAQRSLGLTNPVSGVLLEKMLLPDGSRVPVNFGAVPMFEADLVVVVRDEGVHSATTLLEAARHLSAVVAFIELPDRIAAADEKIDGNLITAMNVSARLGVLGGRRPVEATQEWLEAFANMTVTATDETGAQLAQAKGSALMGNPVQVVLWLARDLAERGLRLKAGDMLSLGTFAPAVPPKAGQTVTVKYAGLPGGLFSASVHFVAAESGTR
jgi:2-keto-4-pentenoate hydratase